ARAGRSGGERRRGAALVRGRRRAARRPLPRGTGPRAALAGSGGAVVARALARVLRRGGRRLALPLPAAPGARPPAGLPARARGAGGAGQVPVRAAAAL